VGHLAHSEDLFNGKAHSSKGLLSNVEDPDAAVPSKVEDPDAAVPSKVEDPGAAVPSKVEDPGAAVPSKVEDPGAAVPRKAVEAAAGAAVEDGSLANPVVRRMDLLSSDKAPKLHRIAGRYQSSYIIDDEGKLVNYDLWH
jgi:hypothetical protein